MVTPNDGTANGSPGTASVTVVNTVPGAPSVAISPTAPSTYNDLACQVTVPSSDAEGDLISYQYSWKLDGASAGIVVPTVLASQTLPDEVWTWRR